MGWEPLIRYDGKKTTTGSNAVSASLGWPGSSNFPTITAENTGAVNRTDMSASDPIGLYNAFFTQTEITKIAFVDGTSISKIPTDHNNYLIYDLYETTSGESISAILIRLDEYQRTAPDFDGNAPGSQSIWTAPSVVNHTASFSGLLVDSSGTAFTSNASGTPLPDKFCVLGINRDHDDDIQALCAYYGSLTSGKGDQWRGTSPSETFWSYWGNDFHSNSQVQRLGAGSQTPIGVATTAAYTGTVYLMGYSDNTPQITPSSVNNRLVIGQSISDISMINTGASAETWSITPTLPQNLTFNTSTGVISGTPIVYDVVGTTYTVSASDFSNNVDTTTLSIKIMDTDSSLGIDYGYPDTSVAQFLNTSLPSTLSSSISLLNIATISNRGQRRSLLRNMFNGLDNSVINSFRTSRTDLNLTNFTKDDVIVYRPGQIIDLAAIDPSQAAYSPIFDTGDNVTFLNVGGSQTVKVTALGDGSYNVFVNDIDTELTYMDGDEYVIAGVSFIFGSVGTEGTNDGGICITGDAQVLTVNGYVPIQDINNTHQLPSGQIKQLVRSINTKPMYLVYKDQYGPNKPIRDTVFTEEHMVYTDTTKSYVLACDLPGVKVIPYDKPVYVYNILTDIHTSMDINGLQVETLNPNNVNALTRGKILKLA